MEFKTFFVKRILMSFFVSVTCISGVMALIGMTFASETRFGYEAFLSPLIFGAIASFPLLVKYSKKELSLKQTIFRNVLHFMLIELLILTVLYFAGLLTTVSMTISLGFSIFLIDLTVNLVLWINDQKTAKEFNKALILMQGNIEDNRGEGSI